MHYPIKIVIQKVCWLWLGLGLGLELGLGLGLWLGLWLGLNKNDSCTFF